MSAGCTSGTSLYKYIYIGTFNADFPPLGYRRNSQRMFGKGCFGYVDNAQNYCCNRRNPFLQVGDRSNPLFIRCVEFNNNSNIYDSFSICSSYLEAGHCSTGLDSITFPVHSSVHTTRYYSVLLAATLAFTSFGLAPWIPVWSLRAINTNILRCINTTTFSTRRRCVTRARLSSKLLLHDGTVVRVNSMCIARPARSKHCRICNKCVARFDHHCAWMNTDVGHNNLKHFLLFLINTSALTGTLNAVLVFHHTHIYVRVRSVDVLANSVWTGEREQSDGNDLQRRTRCLSPALLALHRRVCHVSCNTDCRSRHFLRNSLHHAIWVLGLSYVLDL